jgi:hypothetical protein
MSSEFTVILEKFQKSFDVGKAPCTVAPYIGM